jgi:hypothetical protein
MLALAMFIVVPVLARAQHTPAKSWSSKISKEAQAAGIRAWAALQKYESHINPRHHSDSVTKSYEEEAGKAVLEVKIAAETDAEKALYTVLSRYHARIWTAGYLMSVDSTVMHDLAAKTTDDALKLESEPGACKKEIERILDSGVFSRKEAEASQCGTVILDEPQDAEKANAKTLGSVLGTKKGP